MGQVRYVLVTGSAHADIGKGTVAATFGRALALAGERVSYVKIDPCMQGAIEEMPDGAFGEILRTADGVVVDTDVARAAFLIPGFTPTVEAQRSLGRCLARSLASWHEANVPAPRLADGFVGIALLPDEGIVIVEIGGTAGEAEHEITMEALSRHAGKPALHVHVTAVLRAVDGRPTTKPAQIGIRRLCFAPDVVLVRGGVFDEEALRVVLCRSTTVVSLAESPHAPERAAWAALDAAGVLPSVTAATASGFLDHPALGEVCVVGSGGGARHANLCWRLRLWSQGRLGVRFGQPDSATLGVVLVGSRSTPPPRMHLPTLDLRYDEGRARDDAARVDWRGTLDRPDGPLAAWIDERVEAVARSARSLVEVRPSAYAVGAFALRYLEASEGSALRDHGVLDELVSRAMGSVVGKRILDLGCGAGRWSARLVEAGADVVGVEPSEPMADAAARRALSRFTLLRVSAEEYRPTGAFDGVLASMSLDHVEDVAGVLARLAPSLVPGAWLIVTTEHPLRTAPEDGRRWIEEGPGRAARVRDYGRSGWRRLVWFGRPEPVWVYHRSLSDWVEALGKADLRLVDVVEPVAPDPRDAGNPRFWMLVARK